MTLQILNTLTGQKEEFKPLVTGKVGLYVCGVTVYDLCHIGHARCYIAFDVIQKWLRQNYDVTYVRNFTDVDDKIIKRANELGEAPIALAARFITEYHKDMDALGVAKADVEPKVSTHIQEIIALIKTLEDKEWAYRAPSTSSVEGAGSDMYFRVAKFEAQYKNYLELSKKNFEDMQSGVRVAIDERKESAFDFALWKSAKPGEPMWDSPFGKGRPGWHIECSAMAKPYLGKTFDIHGGGKDLVFPHHSNEIAQSEACHDGAKYANYWIHNGFVNVREEETCPVSRQSLENIAISDRISFEHNNEMFYFADQDSLKCFKEDPEKYLKMSKSLGNFFTIREVLKMFTAEALRWLMISTHYRKAIAFSPRLVENAEKRVAYLYQSLDNVCNYIQQFENLEVTRHVKPLFELFSTKDTAWNPIEDFEQAMNDDFSTPMAVAALLEMLKIANLLTAGKEKEVIGQKLKTAQRVYLLKEWQQQVSKILEILGVGLKKPSEFLVEQKILRAKALNIDVAKVEELLKLRGQARADKEWTRSDEIREQILELGVQVKDGASGQTWFL